MEDSKNVDVEERYCRFLVKCPVCGDILYQVDTALLACSECGSEFIVKIMLKEVDRVHH